ncbi:winged helix DNA-binding domain-containing protein [Ktedonosporobacter rubrisoli]|uniref:Winged helix DNA-binding domain-containing protein n=1 Tax=Ktedonosporobacter rubrisoli TaxID=2509675 RepID=A0A4P6JYM4_KTERU|nr:winged helix DNA-binding domain-containing protein [Ktedonosporobacter rubrisoli]QBD80837.1 winged helix DNA-binding domain-containing protein [Ktedonosporobacter rubrisoli]
MGERKLTLRDLNRSTLARQFLLERTSLSPLDGLKQLIALQAQLPQPPYLGLWTRLAEFERASLTELLASRQAVRATMMRATLQVMMAEDYALLRSALQPALTRSLYAFFGKRVKELPIEQFVEAARVSIQERPRTFAEIRSTLAAQFPEIDPALLAYAVRTQLPLVQVPPAGSWDFASNPSLELAQNCLKYPFASADEGLRLLILRYLAAFGPATIKDMQAWSGLSRLQDVVKRYRSSLRTFRNEQGQELFDLPDAPLPMATAPAPPRFLPEFDNLLLAFAERRRIIADEYRTAVFLTVGRVRATFLLDGFVAGTWKIERGRKTVRLLIEPFKPLSAQVRSVLLAEGECLLHWVADSAESVELQIIDPT